MGKWGAEAILANVQEKRKLGVNDKVKIMTICNTGSLATAGELIFLFTSIFCIN
jgi:methylthioribose-1-phosphate isomerase